MKYLGIKDILKEGDVVLWKDSTNGVLNEILILLGYKSKKYSSFNSFSRNKVLLAIGRWEKDSINSPYEKEVNCDGAQFVMDIDEAKLYLLGK